MNDNTKNLRQRGSGQQQHENGRRNEKNSKYESETNELLSSSQKMEQREKDQLHQQEEENKSLQRTKNMMKSEMDRVAQVSNAIQADTVTIKSTKDQHLGMNDSVKGAKGSLGLLKRQDMEETIIFGISIIFFVLSFLYVMWTRIRIPFLTF